MASNDRYASIPNELKVLNQWVCYRLVERTGHIIKMPCTPDGHCAKVDDPSTWKPFEEVIHAAEAPNGKFDGIGFVLSASDPYVFVDLDKVVSADGVAEEWAQAIIDKMGSYTEYSQSGTGIHIIARAKKPGPRCRVITNPGFELYENVRMVVFTGLLFPGAPAEIRDAQCTVDGIYGNIFGSPTSPTAMTQGTKCVRPLELSDKELIEKAMSASNGGKFSNLWYGNTGEYNGDHSAADLALCDMLAFWTQKDASRIDELFRNSGLMRDKWIENHGGITYGAMTIDKAISNTTKVYDGADSGIVTEEQLLAARQKIGEARSIGTADAVFQVVDQLALLPLGELSDVLHLLKKELKQLDLRTLRGAITKAKNAKRDAGQEVFPTVVVNDRQLRDMGNEAIRLLQESNVPPTLFVRSGMLCQIVEDERGNAVINNVTEGTMTSRLAKTCNFVIESDDRLKNTMPPRSIVSFIMSEDSWPFPALEGVTKSPTIKPDGTVSQKPGYDADTKLFYHRRSDEQPVEVPDQPTKADIAAAIVVIDELLHDFPFDGPASRANAIAFLLSPIIQPAIRDIIPLLLIDAPTAGSGKSLLAMVAGIVSSGMTPDFTTAPTKVDEWSKKITAMLMMGPSMVVIDNVMYPLESSDLAMVLTSITVKDRIFGKNTETVTLPNRAVWVATGNNLQLGGDITRRCVWIRLDPKHSRPHERDGFMHKDLKMWTHGNRSRLLSALLTLCRAWYASGCPSYHVPAFGSYEKWAHTVGCILNHSGISGFIENRDQLWEQSDNDTSEWELFLKLWIETYGTKHVTLSALISDIERGIFDTVPSSLSDALHGKGNSMCRFGKQFSARLGKRYGLNSARLVRGIRTSKGISWRVVCGNNPEDPV